MWSAQCSYTPDLIQDLGRDTERLIISWNTKKPFRIVHHDLTFNTSQNHTHVLITVQFSGFCTTLFNYRGQNSDTVMTLFDCFPSQKAELNFTNNFWCVFGYIMISEFIAYKRILQMLKSSLQGNITSIVREELGTWR